MNTHKDTAVIIEDKWSLTLPRMRSRVAAACYAIKEITCRWIRQGCIISLVLLDPVYKRSVRNQRDDTQVDQTGLHRLFGAVSGANLFAREVTATKR